MVSCGISSPGLQLPSQLGAREECSWTIHTCTMIRSPVVPPAWSRQSFLVSLGVTCGDPPAVPLSAKLSVLIVVTASWLKVKESIISFAVAEHPEP